MNQVFTTTATEADIPALEQLVNGAYRGNSSRQGWTTEADLLDGIRTSEESLRAMIQNPNAQILTYKDAGRLLACVYLELKASDLYLGMLTVSPDVQASGIGRQLLLAAEQIAQHRGCRAITMTVITVRHELIAWYERRGYTPTGKVEPFPDDPRFGIKKQPLEFMVMEKVLSKI
ncbi:GNAT family N-acetyltransferase [Spirosoma aerophilum]